MKHEKTKTPNIIDMNKLQEFTLSIFTENKIGLLNRVTIVFTKRKLNIESITASETEIKGIYRYTIVIHTTQELVEKVIKQLEKQIGVLKAIYYTADQVIYEEIALYKIKNPVKNNGFRIENVVRENFARVLSVEQDFIVIEKTGKKEETQELYDILEPIGILEFARSGRVAVTKPMKELSSYLRELEEFAHHEKIPNGN